jgi:hypothetical protein
MATEFFCCVTWRVTATTNTSEGFSYAEIEESIVAGLYTAFSKKQQLSTEIVLAEIQATRPPSVTRMEDIQTIREWAKARSPRRLTSMDRPRCVPRSPR